MSFCERPSLSPSQDRDVEVAGLSEIRDRVRVIMKRVRIMMNRVLGLGLSVIK